MQRVGCRQMIRIERTTCMRVKTLVFLFSAFHHLSALLFGSEEAVQRQIFGVVAKYRQLRQTGTRSKNIPRTNSRALPVEPCLTRVQFSLVWTVNVRPKKEENDPF